MELNTIMTMHQNQTTRQILADLASKHNLIIVQSNTDSMRLALVSMFELMSEIVLPFNIYPNNYQAIKAIKKHYEKCNM